MHVLICLIYANFALAAATFDLDISTPEQYAAVLAWDQFVPSESPESPFFGIVYMTVTPLSVNIVNSPFNTYTVDTFLYHNVIFATDAGVWTSAPRLAVNGTMKVFDLFTLPGTAAAADCPAFGSSVVFQEVIDALRQGETFAQVTSGGLDAGQLRGQIETRNDIFFAPISIYNASQTNASTVGASLIRIYDIQGYTFDDRASALGLDVYIISSVGVSMDFYGLTVPTNLSAIDFGIMLNTNAAANTFFLPGVAVAQRQYIEKEFPPVYGANSSNMRLYMQDFTDPANYSRTFLGEYIRLPLLSFDGNNVLVFTQTGSSFGGGQSPAGTVHTVSLYCVSIVVFMIAMHI